MYDLMPVLLDSSLSSTVSEYTSIFSTIFTFITGNWYLMALIGIPLVGMIISIVIGVLRR